jgi:hypothetical protein
VRKGVRISPRWRQAAGVLSPGLPQGFDAAGRRWVAEAIAGGILTIDALRNGAAATRALLRGAISPASEAEEPAHIAPAKPLDEAAELLKDFLIALIGLPGDAWPDIAIALPDEVYDRIDRYLGNHPS